MTPYLSPLRYPGGKAKLAPFLIQVLKANALWKPHYVEPYAGGAGAALELLYDEYVDRVTINDADPRVHCFWQAVTRYNAAFLDKLASVRASIREWKRQRAIYESRDRRKVFELGFATFYLNRTTRSGIVHNGGPIGGYDQGGNYKIDARFNPAELADRIERIGRYAHRITVSGYDGLDLLKKLDRGKSKTMNTLVYLDPPYYGKGPELYFDRFDHAQHSDLAEFLSSSPRFDWVMTYDNVKQIRALYQPFPRIAFSLSYSAFERREGEELLIHPASMAVPANAKRMLRAVA